MVKFSKLVNPLLYYIDKTGNSVFRNYCFFENDGYMYEEIIQVSDAGRVLEYRIELDKKIRNLTILFIVITYLIFIHTNFSILKVLSLICLWAAVYLIFREFASRIYSQKVFETYGAYKTVNFNPNISAEKKEIFKKNFIAKMKVILIIIAIVFAPALILLGGISFIGNRKEPNLAILNALTGLYTLIYPKTPLIYDVNAVSKYKNGDFTGAADDYLKIFTMTGSKFTDKDYRRFANTLYLVRKAKGIQNAIDVFNEYSTAKKLNFEQQLKLLWIKSLFCINAQEYEFVVQDYDDLLNSVTGEEKKEFYVLADKAYMLYLMKDYRGAIKIYNNLIPYAQEHKKVYEKQLKSLLMERGFAKLEFGDNKGANEDFVASKVNINEIDQYEPVLKQIDFIVGDF